MTRQDRQTVLDCVDKSRMTLPSMNTWANMLGIDETSKMALRTVAPCKETIFICQPSHFAGTRACGTVAYCENCSHTLAALGAGWNLKTTTRFLEILLRVFCYFRDFPEDSVDDVFATAAFKYDVSPHVCGEDCVLARNCFISS